MRSFHGRQESLQALELRIAMAQRFVASDLSDALSSRPEATLLDTVSLVGEAREQQAWEVDRQGMGLSGMSRARLPACRVLSVGGDEMSMNSVRLESGGGRGEAKES